MKIVVGLGNPGKDYQDTRHNTGLRVVERLQGSPRKDVVFLLSDVFVNNSGRFVKEALEYYKESPENLYVVHDDLDLSLGEYKLQLGIGPHDHKGILDIEEKLKTKNFWRIRVGIDDRVPELRVTGEKYVLEKFNKKELDVLDGVVDRIILDLNDILEIPA